MASAASSLKATNANDRFNHEAEKWDANPFVHEMSKQAMVAIQKYVPAFQANTDQLDVLEIGCGTGLLSFLVARKVHEVVAVDAAEGMIDVLKTKIEKTGTKNICPVAVLLEDPEDLSLPAVDANDPRGLRKKYDLITSHLVLHHIPELELVLKTMLGCLKPGGSLALTDFEDFGPEAKRFHPQNKMGGVERHGINAKWMENLMRECGFENCKVIVAWEHQKKVERWEGEFTAGQPIKPEEGELMNFLYVLCMGTRPRD